MRLNILLLLGALLLSRGGYSQCHADDFAALRELYLDTDGDNWTDTMGWGLIRNNSIPPQVCNLSSMSGVEIHFGGDNKDRVRSLILFNRGLDGDISSEIENMDGMTFLLISGNNITGFPYQSDGLASLQTVNLSNNNLTKFPNSLTNSPSLQDINLSNNDFFGQVLPTEIGNLTNLEKLVIDESRLGGTLPPEIGNLTKLEELSLKQNLLIGTIPNEIGGLTKLRILELSSPKVFLEDKNQFSGILPNTIGNLDSLRYLILGNNNFMSPLPPQIGGLTKLIHLDLFKSNFIGPIPHEIGGLSKLIYFRGSFNAFTSLPPEIGQCSLLEDLELSVTLIDSIPNGIGGLDSLTHFSLASSMVTYVDPDIGGLENLEYLSLSSNPLKSIPQEIGSLENLEGLSFYSCELTALPQSIENLDKLKILDIAQNWLSGYMPCQLGNMDSLEWVDLKYNNFSGCFDSALSSLCGAVVAIGGYEDAYGRGNNLPDWDQFCFDDSYSCPGYIDTVYWELYDTSDWSQHIIWDGRQTPSKFQNVILPQAGNPLYSNGPNRVLELTVGTNATAYTLTIEEGVEFHCPQGSTLEILTERGYEYQSTCGN